MVNLSQIQNGLAKYMDEEILFKLTGWKKWTFGAALSIALAKISNIFNELKGNKMIQMLGVIDDDNNIDIDTIYKEFHKQAEKSAITFDVPMLGSLTLNASDVEKLYSYITEE